MSAPPMADAREVTSSAERLREALSVLPSAVDDEVREELSPYSPTETSDDELTAATRR